VKLKTIMIDNLIINLNYLLKIKDIKGDLLLKKFKQYIYR